LKLLLDTHIWLWTLREPERIARSLTSELKDSQNELWLSSVSVWEALLLHRKGRIQIFGNLVDWVAESTVNLREAPLTTEIVVEAEHLKLHGDPADRFLAATAKVLSLTLVTADKRLLGLGDIATLANR
jgi:PIN domain nuclease of toxin-antitoxin system